MAASAIDEQFRELRDLCNPKDGVATIVLDKVEKSDFGTGIIEADIEDVYQFKDSSTRNYGSSMSTIQATRPRKIDRWYWARRDATYGSLVTYYFRVGDDISQRFQIGETEVFGPGTPAEDGHFILWKTPAPDAPIDKLDERVYTIHTDFYAMVSRATDTIGYLVHRASDTNLNPEIAETVQQHYSDQADDSVKAAAETQA